MNKKNEIKFVPKLRFPEFVNRHVWEKKALKSVSDILMGSSPSSSAYNENKTGLPLLQGNADIKNRLSAPRIYTSEVTKECEIDDILLSVRAPVGTVAKSLHKACIGRGISAIRSINKNSQEYLYQWLISYESYWQNISQGGTFDSVNSDDIRNLLLPIPLPQEQKKIADCLSSLDDVIKAESQKLEVLKEHKKGLLQNLFPQADEKVPKFRFKEFVASGTWTLRIIGDFIKERTEIASLAQPLYSLTIEDGIIPKSERYERSFLVKNEENAYKKLHCGDFAYNPMNLRFGAIARHSSKESVAVSKYYNIFYCDNSVDSLFCSIYFKTPRMITLYDDIAIGTLIEKKRVHFSSFINTKILLPSASEQKEIATCISTLDDLLTYQTLKVKKLNLHKKGLLQGLFPDASEANK